MEQAQAEARGLGHNSIGTEHLLLELIDTGNGVVAHMLRSAVASGHGDNAGSGMAV